jgi:hypothetical protein
VNAPSTFATLPVTIAFAPSRAATSRARQRTERQPVTAA